MVWQFVHRLESFDGTLHLRSTILGLVDACLHCTKGASTYSIYMYIASCGLIQTQLVKCTSTVKHSTLYIYIYVSYLPEYKSGPTNITKLKKKNQKIYNCWRISHTESHTLNKAPPLLAQQEKKAKLSLSRAEERAILQGRANTLLCRPSCP